MIELLKKLPAYITGEVFVTSLMLAILTGLATLVYKNWKNIATWFKRKKLNIFPVKFNVALSLDFQEGLNSGTYFKEIKNNLLKSIDENRLSEIIKIHDFSDIQKFSTIKEAEDFRNKKGVDLIIWGGFSGDGLKKGGEAINKIDLKFTYGYKDDEQRRIGVMINADINSKLAIKNYWEIIDKNSLNDIEVISKNLFDISGYILGLTIKLSGRIGVALKIFESLYQNLKLRGDVFKEQITPHLLNCYTIFITDYGFNKRRFDLGENICNKFLIIMPDNLFALSNLAVFQYRLGKEADAETSVEKLLKLFPGQSITEVDVAFFRIIQKNYKNAYKHYQNLIQFQRVNFNAQEVVEFLFSQYEFKKDPVLLYGAGIVSFYFGDKELAKKTLNEYLLLSNENVCKQMYRSARRLV